MVDTEQVLMNILTEIWVKIDGNYYYWSIPKKNGSKSKNTELPAEYKHLFMNYKLTITTYINLTEEEAKSLMNQALWSMNEKVINIIMLY